MARNAGGADIEIARELRYGNILKEPREVVCRSCEWRARRVTMLNKACPRCQDRVTVTPLAPTQGPRP